MPTLIRGLFMTAELQNQPRCLLADGYKDKSVPCVRNTDGTADDQCPGYFTVPVRKHTDKKQYDWIDFILCFHFQALFEGS